MHVVMFSCHKSKCKEAVDFMFIVSAIKTGGCLSFTVEK